MAFERLLVHPEITSGRAFRNCLEKGYAVVDKALGSSCAKNVKLDIARLKANGRLHLNSTQFVLPGGAISYLPKANIWELSSKELCSRGWAGEGNRSTLDDLEVSAAKTLVPLFHDFNAAYATLKV